MRLCKRCEQEKDISQFYINGKANTYHYCKQCCSEQSLERQRMFKKLCVDYKGGKCCKCGYDKCLAALEFHHLDPSKKDINISRIRRFDVEILYPDTITELDKCILLCSNCHKETHWEINKSKFITIREKPPKQKSSPKYFCLCGKRVSRGYTRCISCANQQRVRDTKIQWPTEQELLQRLETTSYVQLAKELGVTDNAIRGHIRRLKKKKQINGSGGA